MTSKRMAISLPEWLIEDLDLKSSGNASGRIQELMIKGYLSEMKKENEFAQSNSKKGINELHRFLTPEHCFSINKSFALS